jgi:hypothetical protein
MRKWKRTAGIGRRMENCGCRKCYRPPLADGRGGSPEGVWSIECCGKLLPCVVLEVGATRRGYTVVWLAFIAGMLYRDGGSMTESQRWNRSSGVSEECVKARCRIFSLLSV